MKKIVGRVKQGPKKMNLIGESNNIDNIDDNTNIQQQQQQNNNNNNYCNSKKQIKQGNINNNNITNHTNHLNTNKFNSTILNNNNMTNNNNQTNQIYTDNEQEDFICIDLTNTKRTNKINSTNTNNNNNNINTNQYYNTNNTNNIQEYTNTNINNTTNNNHLNINHTNKYTPSNKLTASATSVLLTEDDKTEGNRTHTYVETENKNNSHNNNNFNTNNMNINYQYTASSINSIDNIICKLKLIQIKGQGYGNTGNNNIIIENTRGNNHNITNTLNINNQINNNPTNNPINNPINNQTNNPNKIHMHLVQSNLDYVSKLRDIKIIDEYEADLKSFYQEIQTEQNDLNFLLNNNDNPNSPNHPKNLNNPNYNPYKSQFKIKLSSIMNLKYTSSLNILIFLISDFYKIIKSKSKVCLLIFSSLKNYYKEIVYEFEDLIMNTKRISIEKFYFTTNNSLNPSKIYLAIKCKNNISKSSTFGNLINNIMNPSSNSKNKNNTNKFQFIFKYTYNNSPKKYNKKTESSPETILTQMYSINLTNKPNNPITIFSNLTESFSSNKILRKVSITNSNTINNIFTIYFTIMDNIGYINFKGFEITGDFYKNTFTPISSKKNILELQEKEYLVDYTMEEFYIDSKLWYDIDYFKLKNEYLWKRLYASGSGSMNSNSSSTYSILYSIFNKNFIIGDIDFEIDKFYVYRIRLTAVYINKNKDKNIDMSKNISKDKNKDISKEK